MMMTTMKLSAFYLIIINCTLIVPVPEVDSGTMVIGIDIV